jgi:Flp pilus assembly protein TadG
MTTIACGRCEREYSQRGQSLVEFALICLVLMAITIAILDLGRAVYAYSVVANCAREGARYGSIWLRDHPGDAAAIENEVQAKAVGLDRSQLTVEVTYPEQTTVRVSVSYNFELVTSLIADWLGGGSLTLASSATMYTVY